MWSPSAKLVQLGANLWAEEGQTPASPAGCRPGSVKGVQLAKDARFTRTGKYTAWLSKVKHDGARARFFSSTVTRFFTIDFDKQSFYYSRSESDKDVTALILFHEILEVISAKERPPTLRRSPSSSLLGWGQGEHEEFLFTVVTAKRRLVVKAESAVDLTAWVTALTAARLLGVRGGSGSPEACRTVEQFPREVPASPSSTTAHSSTSAGSRRSTQFPPESCSDGLTSGRQSPSASELLEASLHHEDIRLEAESPRGAEAAEAATPQGEEAARRALEARDFGFDEDDEVCETASVASSRAPSCIPEPEPAPSPGRHTPAREEEQTAERWCEEQATEYLSAEDAARIAADLDLLKRQFRKQPNRARRQAARPDEIDTADDGDDGSSSPTRSSRVAADLGLRGASPSDLGKASDEDLSARIAADLALLGKAPRHGEQTQRGLETR